MRDFEWVSRIFDKRCLGNKRRRRIPNDAINLANEAHLAGRSNVRVSHNFQSVFVGSGVEDALEVCREDPSEVVLGNLLTLNCESADEVQGTKMPCRLNQCVNLYGMSSQLFHGKYSGEITK